MPPTELLERRLAEELRRRGALHPELGAALVVARGRARAERSRWAAELGVPVAVLAAGERGAGLPPGLIDGLDRLAPGIPWRGLVAPPLPGDDGVGGATHRHPSAHRPTRPPGGEPERTAPSRGT